MNDWWTKSSKEKFTERTKCMIDQYNQYKVAGGHHVSIIFLLKAQSKYHKSIKYGQENYPFVVRSAKKFKTQSKEFTHFEVLIFEPF